MVIIMKSEMSSRASFFGEAISLIGAGIASVATASSQ